VNRGPAVQGQAGFWEAAESAVFPESRRKAGSDEAARVITLLDLRQGAKLLDIPCGQGRHAVEFARHGLSVTGVDVTVTYLATARTHAASEGVCLELLSGDMCHFRRAGEFDAVVNLGRWFGYFADSADDRRFLQNAYASLRAGGKLLIETLGKEDLARIARQRPCYERNGSVYLWEWKISADWSWVEDR